MLKREGKHFRRLLLDKITGRDEGRINWGKMWKLAKMAAKMYLDEGKGQGAKGTRQK